MITALSAVACVWFRPAKAALPARIDALTASSRSVGDSRSVPRWHRIVPTALPASPSSGTSSLRRDTGVIATSDASGSASCSIR